MSDTDNPSDDLSSNVKDEVVSEPSSNVPTAEQKLEISKWVADGMGLSEVQKKINQDFGILLTYMDVRFFGGRFRPYTC